MTQVLNKEDIAGRLEAEQFSDTILSKSLSRLPEIKPSGGVWLAGGAIRRTFQGQRPDSDFDFFFKDQQSMDGFIEKLIVLGAQLLSENDKNKKFMLPSTVIEEAYENGNGLHLPEMEIQCINFQFFNSIEDVIDSFDFTICMFGFDGENFHIGDFSLWDLARKKLVVNQITYGVASVRRLMKYANQGFSVCGGCITEVLRAVAVNPEVINSSTLYID